MCCLFDCVLSVFEILLRSQEHDPCDWAAVLKEVLPARSNWQERTPEDKAAFAAAAATATSEEKQEEDEDEERNQRLEKEAQKQEAEEEQQDAADDDEMEA